MSITSAIPYLFSVSDRIYILLFGFNADIYISEKILSGVWRYGGMAVLIVGTVAAVLYWWWKSSFSSLLGDDGAS